MRHIGQEPLLGLASGFSRFFRLLQGKSRFLALRNIE